METYILSFGLDSTDLSWLYKISGYSVYLVCYLEAKMWCCLLLFDWINWKIQSDNWEIWIYWLIQQKTCVSRLCCADLTRVFINLKSGTTAVMVVTRNLGIRGWERKNVILVWFFLSTYPKCTNLWNWLKTHLFIWNLLWLILLTYFFYSLNSHWLYRHLFWTHNYVFINIYFSHRTCDCIFIIIYFLSCNMRLCINNYLFSFIWYVVMCSKSNVFFLHCDIQSLVYKDSHFYAPSPPSPPSNFIPSLI